MPDTQVVEPAGQTPINAPTPTPDSTPPAGGTTGNGLNQEGSGPTTGETVGASAGQSTETTTSPVDPGAHLPLREDSRAAEPAETQTIRLNDGSEISIDEARDGYLRQADYTRKTQEVAEQRRQNEAWHNYYQQLGAQQGGSIPGSIDPSTGQPRPLAPQQPQTEVLSPVAFNEEDYTTETERKLAAELNNTREIVTQMNQRLTGYDERFAATERQRADDHVANEMTQWTAQFNVTEAEILALHDETGVSNVKVLAELVSQRKQGQTQQGVTQAQQVVTAAQNAQVVTQQPRAAPQSTEVAIDYSAPMSRRITQLRAKYPNL